MAEGHAGRVLLAATPIGNAADASGRLRDALASAPLIAAEDTRRLRRLCADLDIAATGRIVSFFDANEAARIPLLLQSLRAGDDVLVVTDAGMPSISDPGYRLVAAAVADGFTVTALPGPSAVLAALAVSALPVDRFCFEGFLPRTGGARRRALSELAAVTRTLVFFEAPHRVAATLADMADAFGPQRRAVACRELTKTYEEIRRGTLADLQAWAAAGLRGELTLVVAGAEAPTEAPGAAQLAAEVADREAAGQSRKQAITDTARARAVPRRTVFDAVVAGKAAHPQPAPLASPDNDTSPSLG